MAAGRHEVGLSDIIVLVEHYAINHPLVIQKEVSVLVRQLPLQRCTGLSVFVCFWCVLEADNTHLLLRWSLRIGVCVLYYIQKDTPVSPVNVNDQGNQVALMASVLVIPYLMSSFLPFLI